MISQPIKPNLDFQRYCSDHNHRWIDS